MGVTLYRAGTTSKVNGIKCEFKVFDEYSYLHNLDTGWFYSPEECYAEKKEPEENPTEEETPEETEAEEADGLLSIDEMSDDEIRVIAKEKNIPHWHNKSIDRLRKEVDIWQPEI